MAPNLLFFCVHVNFTSKPRFRAKILFNSAQAQYLAHMVCNSRYNKSFSHDVMAAILVYLNKETAAILVSQNTPRGIDLHF